MKFLQINSFNIAKSKKKHPHLKLNIFQVWLFKENCLPKKSFIIARSYKSPAIKINEKEPLKTVGWIFTKTEFCKKKAKNENKTMQKVEKI